MPHALVDRVVEAATGQMDFLAQLDEAHHDARVLAVGHPLRLRHPGVVLQGLQYLAAGSGALRGERPVEGAEHVGLEVVVRLHAEFLDRVDDRARVNVAHAHPPPAGARRRAPACRRRSGLGRLRTTGDGGAVWQPRGPPPPRSSDSTCSTPRAPEAWPTVSRDGLPHSFSFSTSSRTAAAERWNAAFSSAVSVISMTCSTPARPSFTGTPT